MRASIEGWLQLSIRRRCPPLEFLWAELGEWASNKELLLDGGLVIGWVGPWPVMTPCPWSTFFQTGGLAYANTPPLVLFLQLFGC